MDTQPSKNQGQDQRQQDTNENQNQEQTAPDQTLNEIKETKYKLYGYLKRSKHEVFLIGLAVLEIDRAFRRLSPADISQSDLDKIHTQVDAVTIKAMEALQKLQPELRNIKDLDQYEDEWRQKRLKEHFTAILTPRSKRDQQETSETEQTDNTQVDNTIATTPRNPAGKSRKNPRQDVRKRLNEKDQGKSNTSRSRRSVQTTRSQPRRTTQMDSGNLSGKSTTKRKTRRNQKGPVNRDQWHDRGREGTTLMKN